MDGIKAVDELDEYLTLPIKRVCDLIAWWWEHRHTYPQLSIMAFDFLNAPGMRDSSHLTNFLLTWYI
jgi:hAT family C-terminal dimerisation region